MGRKSDLTDVSKPLRTDKEKKDALANIDINNYASKYHFFPDLPQDAILSSLKNNNWRHACLFHISRCKMSNFILGSDFKYVGFY